MTLCLPLTLFLAAAFVVPLAGLAPASLIVTGDVFEDAPEEPGLSVANFERAVDMGSGGGLRALGTSLLLSTTVAIASCALCLPPAWMLARHRFRGKALLRTTLALPLTFSGVIVGFLAVLVLGRLGLVPAMLRLLTGSPLLAGSAYTLGGLAGAYVYFEVPRAVLTLEGAIRRLPDELDEAAATLGAGPWTRFARVFLPLMRPALFSTLAVTFSASMGSFGVALILARRLEIVPLSIYTEYTGFLDTGYAAALCLILALTTLAANIVLGSAARGREWFYG
jgi:putative spermidine/putrescine transport system permease protein